MSEVMQQAYLVALVFGLIFGPLTARSSQRREPIKGGGAAQFFNLIGSICFVATLPAVLTALILGGGFETAFPVALSFMVTSFVSLIIFAVFEQQAKST